MKGTDLCWNHTRNPETGKFPDPIPIDRAREIKLLEMQLRSCYRLSPSLNRAKVVMQLIELIERLRTAEGPPPVTDVKELTVEERLARRG